MTALSIPPNLLKDVFTVVKSWIVPEEQESPFLDPLFQDCCAKTLEAAWADKTYRTQFAQDKTLTHIELESNRICFHCRTHPNSPKKSYITFFIRDRVLISKIGPVFETLRTLILERECQKDAPLEKSTVDVTPLLKFASEDPEFYILSCGHGLSREVLLKAVKAGRLSHRHFNSESFGSELCCGHKECKRPIQAFFYLPMRIITYQIHKLLPFLIPQEAWKKKLEALIESNMGTQSIDELFLALKAIEPQRVGMRRISPPDPEAIPQDLWAKWRQVFNVYNAQIPSASMENLLHFLYKSEIIDTLFKPALIKSVIDFAQVRLKSNDIQQVRKVVALLEAAGTPSCELVYELIVVLVKNREFNLAAKYFDRLDFEHRVELRTCVRDIIVTAGISDDPDLDLIRNNFDLFPADTQDYLAREFLSASNDQTSQIGLCALEPVFREILEPLKLEDQFLFGNLFRIWFENLAKKHDFGELSERDYALLRHLWSQVYLMFDFIPEYQTDLQWLWADFHFIAKSAQQRDAIQKGIEVIPDQMSPWGAEPVIYNVANALLKPGIQITASLRDKVINLILEASKVNRTHRSSSDPFFDFWSHFLHNERFGMLGDKAFDTLKAIFDEIDQWKKPRYYLMFLKHADQVLASIASVDPNKVNALAGRWIRGCYAGVRSISNPQQSQTAYKNIQQFVASHPNYAASVDMGQLFSELADIRKIITAIESKNPTSVRPVKAALDNSIRLNFKHSLSDFWVLFYFLYTQSDLTAKAEAKECFNYLSGSHLVAAIDPKSIIQEVETFRNLLGLIYMYKDELYKTFNEDYLNIVNNILTLALQVVANIGQNSEVNLTHLHVNIVTLFNHAKSDSESPQVSQKRVIMLNTWIEKLVQINTKDAHEIARLSFVKGEALGLYSSVEDPHYIQTAKTLLGLS